MDKSRLAEGILDVLKENQRTLNSVIKLADVDQVQQEAEGFAAQQVKQNGSTNGFGSNGIEISEVLEKMTELIELNKATLQTIDLLDKRMKRLFFSSQAHPAEEQGQEEAIQ